MDDYDINESEDFVVDKENLEQYISPSKAYRYCNIVTFLCFIGCYLLDQYCGFLVAKLLYKR